MVVEDLLEQALVLDLQWHRLAVAVQAGKEVLRGEWGVCPTAALFLGRPPRRQQRQVEFVQVEVDTPEHRRHARNGGLEPCDRRRGSGSRRGNLRGELSHLCDHWDRHRRECLRCCSGHGHHRRGRWSDGWGCDRRGRCDRWRGCDSRGSHGALQAELHSPEDAVSLCGKLVCTEALLCTHDGAILQVDLAGPPLVPHLGGLHDVVRLLGRYPIKPSTLQADVRLNQELCQHRCLRQLPQVVDHALPLCDEIEIMCEVLRILDQWVVWAGHSHIL
mmetsp:Transcript_48943/g.111502  ORF Transcript_48943/g.111502 Transcript_48943/m.111502 type:complete len:275 (-) Transcript_48943:1069-1893(-)